MFLKLINFGRNKMTIQLEYTANALVSIARYWGKDITAEQEAWLANEADTLPESEKGKFFDLYYGREA